MRRAVAAGAVLLVLLAALPGSAASTPAQELLAAGRVDDAIAALRTDLRSAPNDAEFHNLLCRAYLAVGRWDDAIAAATQATALQPGNSDYHLWLGRAYGWKAENSNWLYAVQLARKVHAEFERAVELNPRNSAARSDLAEYYLNAPAFLGGGKEKARIQASQIAASDATTASSILAMLAEKEKKYDQQEQQLKAAIQSSAQPAQQWLELARFYRRRGRLNEMESTVKYAVALDGQGETLYEAAEILLAGGRNFAGAVQYLRAYIASGKHVEDAPVFRAHYLLGTLLEKQGDKNGAALEYHSALAMAKFFDPAQAALQRLS